MIETTSPEFAAKILVFSASAAIFWSSLLGLFMLIPHLKVDALSAATKGVNFRQLLSAHLDWFMLAFMQVTAALLIFIFSLEASILLVALMIFGGWMNAVPYFLRAFGINAFVFAGGALQRTANILGGASALAIIIAWGGLLVLAARVFF